ncbi:MAG: hypothetical protein QMD03_03615 [Syntrophales bacterium]|nr:hypothetical protein [Syntrophales bacterium]
MNNMSLTGKTEDKDIVDLEFRQYDSISVSPEKYDPNIPFEIYGDSIVKSLSSPISAVLPDDYLSESSCIES